MARAKKQFNGRIENGKLIMKGKDELARHMQALEGRQIALTISRSERLRSLNQNSYYWGVVLQIIAEETGHTEEELHEFFKAKLLPTKEVKVGNEMRYVAKSTTDLDTLDFHEYIEKIRSFVAQELTITIPDPNTIDL